MGKGDWWKILRDKVLFFRLRKIWKIFRKVIGVRMFALKLPSYPSLDLCLRAWPSNDVAFTTTTYTLEHCEKRERDRQTERQEGKYSLCQFIQKLNMTSHCHQLGFMKTFLCERNFFCWKLVTEICFFKEIFLSSTNWINDLQIIRQVKVLISLKQIL